MNRDNLSILANNIAADVRSLIVGDIPTQSDVAAVVSVRLAQHPEFQDGTTTGEKCFDCGGYLVFSARHLASGLCHYCAHQRLVKLGITANHHGKQTDRR